MLVLVTGATGQQGGALARLLLKQGHRVRAATRNPGSARALVLSKLAAGVGVYWGISTLFGMIQAMASKRLMQAARA